MNARSHSPSMSRRRSSAQPSNNDPGTTGATPPAGPAGAAVRKLMMSIPSSRAQPGSALVQSVLTGQPIQHNVARPSRWIRTDLPAANPTIGKAPAVAKGASLRPEGMPASRPGRTMTRGMNRPGI
jgi:hypothetical protein